jgi:hypothetical protein
VPFVFIGAWLIPLHVTSSSSIQETGFPSFYGLNNIPFFFISLPVDRHLGQFPIVAIVNSTAVETGMSLWCTDILPSGHDSVVELQDHIAILFSLRSSLIIFLYFLTTLTHFLLHTLSPTLCFTL